jgi:hypothetical protein
VWPRRRDILQLTRNPHQNIVKNSLIHDALLYHRLCHVPLRNCVRCASGNGFAPGRAPYDLGCKSSILSSSLPIAIFILGASLISTSLCAPHSSRIYFSPSQAYITTDINWGNDHTTGNRTHVIVDPGRCKLLTDTP